MTTPGQLLDLTPWKLTLPIGPAGKPVEVKPPAIATFGHPEYFTVVGGGVRFRAPVNGTTTSGSKNPRSELREMNRDGSLASWSSTSGAHALSVDMAFTHLPNARTDGGTAGVVGAQIHDADDDVIVWRLEGPQLWLTNGDETHWRLVDGGYELGTRFTARFEVYQGVTSCYYNGRLVGALSKRYSGAYFKVGCYTQANAKNSKPGDATNYGESVVYAVSVSHTPVPVKQVPPEPPVPPPVPSPSPTEPPEKPSPPAPPSGWEPDPEPTTPPPVAPPGELAWLRALLRWLVGKPK